MATSISSSNIFGVEKVSVPNLIPGDQIFPLKSSPAGRGPTARRRRLLPAAAQSPPPPSPRPPGGAARLDRSLFLPFKNDYDFLSELYWQPSFRTSISAIAQPRTAGRGNLYSSHPRARRAAEHAPRWVCACSAPPGALPPPPGPGWLLGGGRSEMPAPPRDPGVRRRD